jgi:SAM-dependent methyltransferase
MQSNPVCPACNGAAWEIIGSRTYHRADQQKVTPYVRKRLEVLFDVWNKGEPAVTLTSVLCQRCGFVCYTPRPGSEDISRKYAFLSKDEATKDEISLNLASDTARSNELYRHLRTYLRRDMSVLDFGGGTGRLMRAFLEHGHDCSLIDYPGEKLPGVHYLGSQPSDIESGRRFDLVVCSHVLEHLADPCSALLALRPCLAPDSILYIEVPLEIWKQVPLPVEPVTHINYFTIDSLRTLLERAGFDVLSCNSGVYTNEDGNPGLAIRAYAKCADSAYEGKLRPQAAATTRALLSPGPARQLAHAFAFPAITRVQAKRTLVNFIGKTPLLWRIVQK